MRLPVRTAHYSRHESGSAGLGAIAPAPARLWDAATGDPITPPLKQSQSVEGAQFSGDESRILTWSDDGTARLWDITTDAAWPIGKFPLRVEVETGTTLDQGGEVKALSAADWNRKRFCEYDAIRHELKRISDAEWTESQRRCRKAQEADAPELRAPVG